MGSAIMYSLLLGARLVVDAGRRSVAAWFENRGPAQRRVAEVRIRV